MPALTNARHERFAQALAKGMAATSAYEQAGYKADRGAASRLSANVSVQSRLAELQNKAAEKAVVTIDSIATELDEARSGALGGKQFSAAVAASMGKAKLYGLLVDKAEVTGKDGGPIVTASHRDRAKAILMTLKKATDGRANTKPN